MLTVQKLSGCVAHVITATCRDL